MNLLKKLIITPKQYRKENNIVLSEEYQEIVVYHLLKMAILFYTVGILVGMVLR
jgi:hypothetical protein